MSAASNTVRADWRRTTLGEMFDIGSSKRVLKSQWKKSGVPFYRAREIVRLARDGVVDNDLFISEDHFQSLSNAGGVPQAGDLMVSAVGTLGACYEVKEGDRFYYKDASVLLFRPRVQLEPRFMEYAFLSDDLLSKVNSGQGATVGTFTITRARETEFLLPPPGEQKRIVSILDQAFAALDRARAHAEANLADLETLLVNASRTILESKEGGWIAIGDLCEIYQPKTISKKEMKSDGRYPVYGANGQIGRYDKFNHEESQVLVTCRGATCGRINVSEPFSWITGNAMVVRPRDGRLLNDYLELYLRVAMDWTSVITGAAQPQITRKSLAPTKILVPPLDMQIKSAQKLEALRSKVQKLTLAFEARLSDITALRQSILQQAFSGQLT